LQFGSEINVLVIVFQALLIGQAVYLINSSGKIKSKFEELFLSCKCFHEEIKANTTFVQGRDFNSKLDKWEKRIGLLAFFVERSGTAVRGWGGASATAMVLVTAFLIGFMFAPKEVDDGEFVTVVRCFLYDNHCTKEQKDALAPAAGGIDVLSMKQGSDSVSINNELFTATSKLLLIALLCVSPPWIVAVFVYLSIKYLMHSMSLYLVRPFYNYLMSYDDMLRELRN
jgi:hypothetical protein